MIPDSFYKINADAKSNGLAGLGKEERRLQARQNASPEKKKSFDRVMSNKERGERNDDPDQKKVNGEDLLTEAGEEQLALKKREGLLTKKGPQPLLDPLFNQAPSVAKDSKVAPKLGKEKPAAPPEEPWSEPYVEKLPEEAALVKGILGKESRGALLSEGEEPKLQELPDSPAMLFGKMAKDSREAPVKPMQFFKETLGKYIPAREDIEIFLPKQKESGFSLAPVKSRDEDIALINLAVIALGPGDTLVSASTLKPVAKVPQVIMDVVEKITNEVKHDITKTTIVLKDAGIFTGVEVTVTSFKTARSEINIQFSNMTQEAKNVLETNLDALKQALDQKGYTVHMIAATTLKDETVYGSSSNINKERENSQQQGRGQREKKQDEEEDA
ncbi:hypothetical protein [Estrella lausannensis]|uniref:Uncharacterized protein n=1 Tax=Estrella lausannensis TaxID=483423 RepID=A0A0H5DP88_9BACT|nr:hypothetical protein [Estrella lausannensis]CRX37748.1 Conserved hypothetical protein [Estrella lausannensis]